MIMRSVIIHYVTFVSMIYDSHASLACCIYSSRSVSSSTVIPFQDTPPASRQKHHHPAPKRRRGKNGTTCSQNGEKREERSSRTLLGSLSRSSLLLCADLHILDVTPFACCLINLCISRKLYLQARSQ